MSANYVIDPEQNERPDHQRIEIVLARIANLAKQDTPKLVFPSGETIDLTPSLAEVIRDAVKVLSAGHAITLSPLHRMMTTTEAADILGISRQFLTRLLDRGEIAFERPNSHRRLKLADVLAFKERRDAERLDILNEMTRQSESLGAYE